MLRQGGACQRPRGQLFPRPEPLTAGEEPGPHATWGRASVSINPRPACAGASAKCQRGIQSVVVQHANVPAGDQPLGSSTKHGSFKSPSAHTENESYCRTRCCGLITRTSLKCQPAPSDRTSPVRRWKRHSQPSLGGRANILFTH